jgi:hypothetical protein
MAMRVLSSGGKVEPRLSTGLLALLHRASQPKLGSRAASTAAPTATATALATAPAAT